MTMGVNPCNCGSDRLNKKCSSTPYDVKTITSEVQFSNESFRESCSELVRDKGGIEIVGEDVGGGERWSFEEDDVLRWNECF